MIPTPGEVPFGSLALDGGTINLELVDLIGVSHRLCLVQHISPVRPSELKHRGGLYFDDALVEIRSSDETVLLNFLRTARITASSTPPPRPGEPFVVLGEDLKEYFAAGARSPADAIRYLVNELVAFVDSDEYVCYGVQDLLTAIESVEDVRVLLAVEAGSRGRGTVSRDSTYDVRFVYIHRKEWYASVRNEPIPEVINRSINDSVNLSGWDVKKVLRLLAKANPPILQWLSSPAIYMQKAMTSLRLRELLARQSGSSLQEEPILAGLEPLKDLFAGLLNEVWNG